MKPNLKLARFSWALYDFANTIFSMNIISLYFVLWLTVDKNCPELYYSLVLAASVLFAGLGMPLIGHISDILKRRVPFLIAFTCGCVFFTILMGLTQTVAFALIFFFFANLFYQLAIVSYNTLLVRVSTTQNVGRTSGLGVSLGYLGAILGLHLVRPFLQSNGIQATFIPTALLFLFFAIPAFIFIKDSPHPRTSLVQLQAGSIFTKLIADIKELRQSRPVSNFLISMFLCLNAVNTVIIFMAIYAKQVMQFSVTKVIYFMSISSIFAIFGSYGCGYLVDKWGSKKTLLTTMKLWCLALFLAAISTEPWMFWIVGPLSGICLGCTWVSARTLLLELTPREKVGQMFGLFGLAGKFSAIIGPVTWGLIVYTFSFLGSFKYRLAIASVLAFMLAGYFVLKRGDRACG